MCNGQEIRRGGGQWVISPAATVHRKIWRLHVVEGEGELRRPSDLAFFFFLKQQQRKE